MLVHSTSLCTDSRLPLKVATTNPRRTYQRPMEVAIKNGNLQFPWDIRTKSEVHSHILLLPT